MASSDQYWDLAITEAEGRMTIVDRKRITRSNIKGNLYTFDYYDADSLIKSLRFRPALSDAVATRAIYGQSNNKNSKFSIIDPNDLLVYIYKDDVILPDEDRQSGGNESQINKQANFFSHLRAMLVPLQVIDQDGDKHLQMTIPNQNEPAGADEVIKLVLPNQELLRLILHDEDRSNNPIYCAVQPNITMELNILGVGGLRTFQYFLVRNLPEPYSHKNIIFRITDVIQHLEAGNWETTIRAGLLPLTKYITDRVRPEEGWPAETITQLEQQG
jgi:hypothetical protein